MKSSTAIILVETETPDNIGAAARAMKNMGLSDLRLVRPPRAWKQKARKMAMAAGDLLESAKVFSTLRGAAADRNKVIGTTRRQGAKRGIFIPFGELIRFLSSPSPKKSLRPAIVFGKESKGLSNADLAVCDWLATIPSSDIYPSINLAQSVMIVAFSITIARENPLEPLIPKGYLASAGVSKEEMREVLSRAVPALLALGYDHDGRKNLLNRILATLDGFFRRNGLLEKEAQMLRGLFRRICEKTSQK